MKLSQLTVYNETSYLTEDIRGLFKPDVEAPAEVQWLKVIYSSGEWIARTRRRGRETIEGLRGGLLLTLPSKSRLMGLYDPVETVSMDWSEVPSRHLEEILNGLRRYPVYYSLRSESEIRLRFGKKTAEDRAALKSFHTDRGEKSEKARLNRAVTTTLAAWERAKYQVGEEARAERQVEYHTQSLVEAKQLLSTARAEHGQRIEEERAAKTAYEEAKRACDTYVRK